MGWDYALVHINYTIPPAIVLTIVFWPLASRIDYFRILLLIFIAVASTIPWDSYLIYTSIWTYPPGAVLGPTLLRIPLEELFFFIVQTYTTSILYLLLARHVVHGAQLRTTPSSSLRISGQIALSGILSAGLVQTFILPTHRYLGLILIWALPFILLLWTVSYESILSLPWTATLLPILLPTLYLWVVDTLAMHRGTWAISSGTKTGIFLWPHLEIEEAIFFLLTNVLVVFGQIAIDTTLSIIDNLGTGEGYQIMPGPVKVFEALTTSCKRYDEVKINGLREGLARLKAKSRSFYLASAAFQGSLREDLILLYSFCRAADDMVDEAEDIIEAQKWVTKLTKFIEICYTQPPLPTNKIRKWIEAEIPRNARSAFLALPTARLDKQPLLDLFRGFEMDLQFGNEKASWPIASPADLEVYGQRVAGTVAHLVMNLVFYHCRSSTDLSASERSKLLTHADNMGVALQLVNIARDVRVDAAIDRVYLPASLLKTHHSLTPEQVLSSPDSEAVRETRMLVLQRAFELYDVARSAIERVPAAARPGMRVAVESYMEIGRTMWEQGCRDRSAQRGRATVPVARRLWVAWTQML